MLQKLGGKINPKIDLLFCLLICFPVNLGKEHNERHNADGTSIPESTEYNIEMADYC